MSNEVILVLAGLALIVVAARKWDTLKWWLGLGLVVLAIATAWQMGLFDDKVKQITDDLPSVSVE